MLRETGKVIEIKTINGEKKAVVECVSKSACKSCGNNNDCGVGVISKATGSKTHHLTMPYKEGMVVNEQVELLIDNSEIIKSSMIVYIIPLILFVLGTTVAYLYIESEPLVILISVLCLGVGVMIARFVSVKLYPQQHINKLISTK